MSINNVQQQVGVAGLLKGSPESLDELVWKMADKSHGICQHDRPEIGEVEPAQRGVQRGEQLVCRIDLGRGQGIEKRGFTRVGIPHE